MMSLGANFTVNRALGDNQVLHRFRVSNSVPPFPVQRNNIEGEELRWIESLMAMKSQKTSETDVAGLRSLLRADRGNFRRRATPSL